ncbi:BON domain-containing protein [Granulicella sp. 5B5]|uniref:BON domain-containing protein n=1 Tax=Granulicella sp. 5B5 TaxID=1617967 RepID=UPI0015F3FCF9|nr:BON domain-containing protein [Granulicella sp. 5B5]QMV17826.1 BON domain-containing protein [Granulicella sp. 5B5]
MRKFRLPAVGCLAFGLMYAGAVSNMAQAQTPAHGWSQDDGVRVVKEVQQRLRGLPDYDVFDWITFGVEGRTVVLHGFASRPSLKSEAASAVKGIAGVAAVENQIKVLPYSPNDDRVRAQVYNRIYTSPALSRYNANAGPLYRGLSVARMAGGITNDPPLGFHAIHIIVDNGHVALYGVVDNSGDSAMANIRANSAPGAFSVDNNLIVAGSKER